MQENSHPLSKLEVISAFSGLAGPRSGFLTVISFTVSVSRAQPALGSSSSNVTGQTPRQNITYQNQYYNNE